MALKLYIETAHGGRGGEEGMGKGLMLKLKLQYFGHLMQRADSFERALMLGKIEGRRRRGQQRMKWWDGITDSMDISLQPRCPHGLNPSSCLLQRVEPRGTSPQPAAGNSAFLMHPPQGPCH